MAVNYETGIVTGTPITEPDELQKLVGISTNEYAAILLANSINPYSKKKPVESGIYHYLTDAQFAAVDWGYRIPTAGIKKDAFRAYVRNGTVPAGWGAPSTPNGAVDMGFGWYYIRPHSLGRPADFLGYNHKAKRQLFGEVSVPSQGVNQNTQSMYIQFNRGTFALNDFGTYANMHLGVIIMMQGSNTVWYKAIPDSGTDPNYPTITFSRSEMNTMFAGGYGNYDVWAVATPEYVQNVNSGGSYYNSQFTSIYPLPGSKATFNYSYQGVTSASITFILRNLDTDGRYMYFDLYAKNTGAAAGAVNVVNLKYKIAATDADGNSWEQSSIDSLASYGNKASGNVSVPTGGNEVYIDTYSGVPYQAYRYLSDYPWFIDTQIWYPNSAGTFVKYDSGQMEYYG